LEVNQFMARRLALVRGKTVFESSEDVRRDALSARVGAGAEGIGDGGGTKRKRKKRKNRKKKNKKEKNKKEKEMANKMAKKMAKPEL
jgi:hypothetical protein